MRVGGGKWISECVGWIGDCVVVMGLAGCGILCVIDGVVGQ